MDNRQALRLTRIAALVTLSAVVTTPAFGYFKYDGGANQFFDNPPAGDRPVVQVGSGDPSQVSSFGQEVPLSGALNMITPEGWQVRAPEVDDPAVSWEGEQAWTKTLEKIAADEDLRFLVNWDKKALLVAKNGQTGPGEGPSDEFSNMAEAGDGESQSGASGEGVSVSGNDASKSADGTSSDGPKERTWTLEAGGIRDQLDAWADKAGYRYVWHAPDDDYLVEVDVEIEGTFLEVMRQVVGSLHSTGVPIRADIYRSNGNEVVVIRES